MKKFVIPVAIIFAAAIIWLMVREAKRTKAEKPATTGTTTTGTGTTSGTTTTGTTTTGVTATTGTTTSGTTTATPAARAGVSVL